MQVMHLIQPASRRGRSTNRLYRTLRARSRRLAGLRARPSGAHPSRRFSGTGIFANATGSLHNRGLINLNDFTLTYDVHGRMCGDGL
jgi:hypothetical protein